MPQGKIPVNGFVITCLKCKSHKIKIETRQDGTHFQCMNCGNKLIIRPGETFNIFPNQEALKRRMQEQAKRFKEQLDNTPMDDWPSDVLNEYLKKNGDEE